MTEKRAESKTRSKKSTRSSSSVDRAVAVRFSEDQKLVEDLQRQTRFEDFHAYMDLPTFQANAVLSMLDLLYPAMPDEEKADQVPNVNGDELEDIRATRAYLAMRKHHVRLIEELGVADTAEAILKGEGLQKILLREQIRAAMGAQDSRERSVALEDLMARIAPVARESAGMVLFQMTREDVDYLMKAEREILEEKRVMKQIEAPKRSKKTARRAKRRGPAGGEKKGGGG